MTGDREFIEAHQKLYDTNLYAMTEVFRTIKYLNTDLIIEFVQRFKRELMRKDPVKHWKDEPEIDIVIKHARILADTRKQLNDTMIDGKNSKGKEG